MKLKFNISMLGLVCALAAVMGFVFLVGPSTSASEEHNVESDLARTLSRVLVKTIEARDLHIERSFTARTDGSQVVEVVSRVQGGVDDRLFKEGQLVEQGETMFVLDPYSYELMLQKADAELHQAQAGYAAAQRDWDRISNLYRDGAISANDKDKAQSQLEIGLASVKSAEAKRLEMELLLSYTQVKAPITGIASRAHISVGNLIKEGETLAVITRLDPLYVRFSIPENSVAAKFLLEHSSLQGEVTHVEGVTLSHSNGTEHPYSGIVDYVARVIDKKTGNMEVRAVFPNPDYQLLPGQFVRLELPPIEMPQAILVPQRAVVQSGRNSVVYIVDALNQVQSREVRLGVRVENQQLIEAGLEPGDRVIVEGLSLLQAGQEVRAEEVQ